MLGVPPGLPKVSPQMPADYQADKAAVFGHANRRGVLLLRTMRAVFAGMD
jgi:hypothetical protein